MQVRALGAAIVGALAMVGCSTSGEEPLRTTLPAPLTSTVRPASTELVDALAEFGVALDAMPAGISTLSTFPLHCGAEVDVVASPDVRRCFLDAHLAREPATFVRTYGTVEGDPIVEVWGTDASGQVIVFTDSTRDSFGSGRWARGGCERLTATSPTPGFDCARFKRRPPPPDPNTGVAPPPWYADRPSLPSCGTILDDEKPDANLRCFFDALTDGEAAELAIELPDGAGARWLRSLAGGEYAVFEVRYEPTGPNWTQATCTSQLLSDLLAPLSHGECPRGDGVRFFDAEGPGVPARYVALGRDGGVRLVETATGEASELAQVEPFPKFVGLSHLTIDPTGANAYVAHDRAGDCLGEIVRVPLDGGEPEVVAAGASPVLSPDGRWMAYTIDGYTARGEDPPPISDPDIPCRSRHDSYVWRDLESGNETRWIAPSPTAGAPPNPTLHLAGFDPTSTELAMTTSLIESSLSIVTLDEPNPQAAADARESFANGYLPAAYGWLADGSVLVRLGAPEPAVVPPTDLGLTAFAPPVGYTVSPVDVSTPWWLLAGFRDADPRDYGPFTGTWAWDQDGEPIPLAENAIVVWLPDP